LRKKAKPFDGPAKKEVKVSEDDLEEAGDPIFDPEIDRVWQKRDGIDA
jgi:hypothetical protein